MKKITNLFNKPVTYVAIMVIVAAIATIGLIHIYVEKEKAEAVEAERARVERQQTRVDVTEQFAGPDGIVEARYNMDDGNDIYIIGDHETVSQIEWFLDWQCTGSHPNGVEYYNCNR